MYVRSAHTGRYFCALYRELFIRRVNIEHQKWFETMVGKIFGSKNEMRRLLSLKKTAYNSWTEYSRITHMPFGQLKVFWHYLDETSKDMLPRSAKASTQVGAKEWQRLWGTANTYDVTGPMESQDPTMPIDMKDLESKILGADETLRARWKKRDLHEWAIQQEQGNPSKPYKASKRAASTDARVRLPGDKCPACVSSRIKYLPRLKKLRDGMKKYYDLLPSVICVWVF